MERIWLHSALFHIFRQRDSWQHKCSDAPLTLQMILITALRQASLIINMLNTSWFNVHAGYKSALQCEANQFPVYFFPFPFLSFLLVDMAFSLTRCQNAAGIVHQPTPPPSASSWKAWQRVSSKASSLPESQPNSPACHAEPAKEAPDEPPHWHTV